MSLYSKRLNVIIREILKITNCKYSLETRCYAKSTNQCVDGITLDDFTDKLIEEKCWKWKSFTDSKQTFFQNLNINLPHTTAENDDYDKIFNSRETLSIFLEKQLQSDSINIDSLLDKCIKYSCLPFHNTFIKLLSICSERIDEKKIVVLLEIYKKYIPAKHDKYGHCRLFLAEAVWLNGNFNKSLSIFKEIYAEHPLLHYKIRIFLDNLISGIIESKTEAALVQVVKFTEHISYKYKDFYPMMSLWQACFLSEWYSDQTLAINMIDRKEALREALKDRILLIVATIIRMHRLDAANRLIEVLLKYEMKPQYVRILELLFDYHCWSGDYRRCTEVVKWCSDLNIELRDDQLCRYISLFLDKKSFDISNPKVNKPEFKLKF